tara:strand:+ start:428 stop:667 length:240 start_codon:yes stop_codon:yes gene_type:complete
MVRRCFGDPADITRIEAKQYKRYLDEREEKLGWRRTLTQDEIYTLRKNLQEGLNELLNWVGIGATDAMKITDELLGWRG